MSEEVRTISESHQDSHESPIYTPEIAHGALVLSPSAKHACMLWALSPWLDLSAMSFITHPHIGRKIIASLAGEYAEKGNDRVRVMRRLRLSS